ncbi:tetratricopeptide repeat protein [Solemya velesiana gill symbiont]|nr:tetratricopeptide repeat protein [Solemya velesiana gill symbiont]
MDAIKYPLDAFLNRLIISAMLLVLGTSTTFADSASLDQLSDLVKNHQDTEAYQLASELRDEYEGEPKFDFWYGVASINAGKISEGIFTLERLHRLYPRDDAVRMQLGRAYYLLEEDERARHEFKQVLKHDPSESVRQTAEQFLKAIDNREGRYRDSGQAWIQGGIGYDSNINSGPSSSDLPFWFPSSSAEQSDIFASLGVGGSYSHPLSPTSQFKIGGHLKHRAYEDGDFDNTEGYLRAELELRSNSRLWDIFLKGQKFYVDGDENRELLGGGLEWRNELSKSTEINAFVQFADLKYPSYTDRDADQTSFGIGFEHDFSGRWSPRLFATLYIAEEDADNILAEDVAERDITGFRAGLQLAVSSRLNLYGILSAETSRYGDELFPYGVRRDDSYYSLQLGGSWYIDENWSIQAELRPSWNDSNIDEKEFERTEASMQVRYDFR